MRYFADEIIKTIEEKKIAPKPKWQFLLRNYLIWSFLILSMILGTISVSIILLLLTNYDWDVYRYLNHGPIENVLVAIPYFWLIFLLLVVTLIYHNFRNTGRGYRQGMYMIVAVTLCLNLVGGVILFASGFGAYLNNTISNRVPMYHGLIHTPSDTWAFPDRGLLGGRIVSVENKNSFVFAGLDGKLWQIEAATTTWPTDLTPQIGLELKIIGQPQKNQVFQAIAIRPWGEIEP